MRNIMNIQHQPQPQQHPQGMVNGISIAVKNEEDWG